MGLQLITAPVLLPVSLDRLKQHLRVTHAFEDDLLADYLRAAVRQVEALTWRALLTQTFRLTLDDFPQSIDDLIYVPRPRLQSVTAISYLDTDGEEQTLDPADYEIDAVGEPGRIRQAIYKSWPQTLRVSGCVSITYVAGWTSAAAVPSTLVAAVLLAAASLYETREDSDASKNTTVLDLCRLEAVHDPRVCVAFD